MIKHRFSAILFLEIETGFPESPSVVSSAEGLSPSQATLGLRTVVLDFNPFV